MTTGELWWSRIVNSVRYLDEIQNVLMSEDVKPEPACEAGWRMLLPMAVYALLIIGLGMFSGGMITYLEGLARTLL